MKIQRIFVFSLVMALSPFAFASEESHQNAAKELMEVFNIDTMLDSMHESVNAGTAQSFVRQDPCLESIKKPLADLFTKHSQKAISAESLKRKMQEIYAEEFTESEIREIIAFYKTPVGQKTLKKMPILMAKGAEFAQEEIAKAYNSEAVTKLQQGISQLIKSINPKHLSPECKKHFEKDMQQLK